MNYIREINAFYDWLETNSISDSAIVLWHALMHISNRAGWITEFAVALSTLETKTGLKKDAIIRARNRLQQVGRIGFQSRNGQQSAIYSIKPFETCVVLNDTNCDTNRNTNRSLTATQSASITKLNKTKQKRDLSKFENFYQAYPRHNARKDAEKAWAQVAGDSHFEQIMIAVEVQKKSVEAWFNGDMKHIPLPASWLRGERWKDEVEQPIAPAVTPMEFEPWEIEANRRNQDAAVK